MTKRFTESAELRRISVTNGAYYLRQGGCFRRCLSVCLFVCLLATLCKNFRTDLHEIFRKGR